MLHNTMHVHEDVVKYYSLEMIAVRMHNTIFGV